MRRKKFCCECDKPLSKDECALSSAGSLGQGLSVANGIALAFKKLNKPRRVYCLLGDGKLQEGQIWEAAMFAPQHQLDNVCVIVDFNHVQLDGTIEEIKNLDNLSARL